MPAALGLALSVCPFGSETPAGYARIAGTVRMENGSAWRGSVYIGCGGSGRTTTSDAWGRYAMEYDVDLAPPGYQRPGDPEGDFVLVCSVSAPGDQPPFARRYVDVPFHRARGDRVTTVVDLVEGEIEG